MIYAFSPLLPLLALFPYSDWWPPRYSETQMLISWKIIWILTFRNHLPVRNFFCVILDYLNLECAYFLSQQLIQFITNFLGKYCSKLMFLCFSQCLCSAVFLYFNPKNIQCTKAKKKICVFLDLQITVFLLYWFILHVYSLGFFSYL